LYFNAGHPRPPAGGGKEAAAWGINPYAAALYRTADARRWGTYMLAVPESRLASQVTITVDMESRSLYMAFDGGAAQLLQAPLPAAVRPWALLQRPGSSVTLSAYERLRASAVAQLPKAVSPTAEEDSLFEQRWAELGARYLSGEAYRSKAAPRATAAAPPQTTFRQMLGPLFGQLDEMQAEELTHLAQ